jgi:galactokinase
VPPAEDPPGRARLAEQFVRLTGRQPAGIWSAPGRATLIGEHLDYNDGHVLPYALSLRTRVAVAPRRDDRVRCWSLQQADAPADVDLAEARTVTGWPAYVVGTAWAMRQAGAGIGGVDVVVDGDVPTGGGLSSSAALEMATALALDELFDTELTAMDLARAGQRAEHDVVGAPVGVMDQAASLLGTAGHALLLDCRSLAHEPVALPLAETDTRLVVIDSHVSHDVADGEYAARRAACEQVAAALGVVALRDATTADLDAAAGLDDELRRRARHVLTEERRVLETVALLGRRDMAEVGRRLTASHASLRDDYEVSVPEIDGLVEAALRAGALGARIVGAGFGGCVLALAEARSVDDVVAGVKARAAGEDWPQPTTYDGQPSGGARRDS